LSNIYGVEHLLRMFVKLPPLLGQIGASEEELRGLRAKFQDMLKFLQRKKDRFLSSTEYVKASLSYVQAFERNLGGGSTSASSKIAAASADDSNADVLPTPHESGGDAALATAVPSGVKQDDAMADAATLVSN
jgi:hypothetical protein